MARRVQPQRDDPVGDPSPGRTFKTLLDPLSHVTGTDTFRERLGSDVVVYVGSGLFAILVFALALALATRYGPAGLGTSGELSGLVIGFSAFIAVYFISLGVWYYVRR